MKTMPAQNGRFGIKYIMRTSQMARWMWREKAQMCHCQYHLSIRLFLSWKNQLGLGNTSGLSFPVTNVQMSLSLVKNYQSGQAKCSNVPEWRWKKISTKLVDSRGVLSTPNRALGGSKIKMAGIWWGVDVTQWAVHYHVHSFAPVLHNQFCAFFMQTKICWKSVQNRPSVQHFMPNNTLSPPGQFWTRMGNGGQCKLFQ